MSILATAVIGGLLFLGRRRRRGQPSDDGPDSAAGPVVEVGGTSLALATTAVPLGPPPVLLPAAIIRQILVDPRELTPEWARPRPKPVAQEPQPSVESVEEAASAAPVEPPAENQPSTSDATPPATTATEDAKPPKRTRRPKSTAPTTRRRTKTSG
jgi:hypothetical protein